MFNFYRTSLVTGISGIDFERREKAKVLFNQAYDYFEQKNYEKAIEDYTAAFETDPAYTRALIDCSDAYFLTVDFQKAKECLLRAIKTADNDPKAHNNLGNIYIMEGDKENAKREYKKALKINLFYEQARYNLKHLNTLAGDLYDNLGIELQKRGKHSEAIPLHQKAIEFNTTFPAKSHNNLGFAYYSLNDFDNAILCYDKALQIDPSMTNSINFRKKAYDKKQERELKDKQGANK